jgi:hypothetical protein
MKICDESLEIIFVWDTMVFRVCFWALRGIPDGFPVGYWEVSFAKQQWEAIGSRSFPVRENSDWNTASMFQVPFRPVPA